MTSLTVSADRAAGRGVRIAIRRSDERLLFAPLETIEAFEITGIARGEGEGGNGAATTSARPLPGNFWLFGTHWYCAQSHVIKRWSFTSEVGIKRDIGCFTSHFHNGLWGTSSATIFSFSVAGTTGEAGFTTWSKR